EEDDAVRLRRERWAGGAAVDARGGDAGDELAVEADIARADRAVALGEAGIALRAHGRSVRGCERRGARRRRPRRSHVSSQARSEALGWRFSDMEAAAARIGRSIPEERQPVRMMRVDDRAEHDEVEEQVD